MEKLLTFLQSLGPDFLIFLSGVVIFCVSAFALDMIDQLKESKRSGFHDFERRVKMIQTFLKR